MHEACMFSVISYIPLFTPPLNNYLSTYFYFEGAELTIRTNLLFKDKMMGVGRDTLGVWD